MTAFVWYDKSATDERVWCVRSGDTTVRAVSVEFRGLTWTMFKADGFMDLQPGGPRGVIACFEGDFDAIDAESIA